VILRPLAFGLVAFSTFSNAANSAPVLGGLELWLDSGIGVEAAPGDAAKAGDLVSRWLDQSGNNRHFSQASSSNRPVFQDDSVNGSAALSFNGENQWLQGPSIPSLGSSSLTIFAVLTGEDSTSEQDQEQAIFADVGWSGAVLQRSTYVDGTLTFYSNWTPGNVPSASVSTAPGSLPNSGFSASIVSAIKDLNTLATVSVDSLFDATDTSGVVLLPYTGGTTYIGAHFEPLGAGATSDYTGYHGSIAELLVYSTALNESDFAATNHYLQEKYGLTAIPEPTVWSLMLAGFAIFGFRQLRVRAPSPN
jgi:hypothetical protein